MKGLIIKSPWSKLILDGKKTMELRGSNTKIRGTIGIIESSSGHVLGTVDLVDVKRLDDLDFLYTVDKHKVMCNREDIS